jgi:hypothetical protein
VTYAQNQDKRDLLINKTTVLPLSGRVGHSNHTFSGSDEHSLHPSRLPKRAERQDRRIIPAKFPLKLQKIGTSINGLVQLDLWAYRLP